MRYGFDELNFDYIRFPSDGILSNMAFPVYEVKLKKPEFLKIFPNTYRLICVRGE